MELLECGPSSRLRPVVVEDAAAAVVPPWTSGSLRGREAYSPASRANRAVPVAAARGAGMAVFSTALSSIEAIFVTDTTSTSSARPQAVLSGSLP